MSIRVDADEPFHVLIGQAVVEMTLDALDDAYHGEVISEETLIWQEGLGEWLRLDIVLDRLASQEANEDAVYSLPAPPPAPDVYFVLVSGDDTKQMNLDQLDDAYRLDIIDEATLVWQPGFSEWIPLSELLSLQEQEAPVVSPAFYPQASERMQVSSAPQQQPARSSAPVSTGYVSTGYVLGRPADSTRPVTSSVLPTIEELTPPPSSPWYKRGLLSAAAIVALFSAHQYGLTHAVAAAAHKDAALTSFLGGPNVATPSGLDQWLGALSAENGLDKLAATDAVKPAPRPAAAAPVAVAPAATPTVAPAPAAPAALVAAAPSAEPAVSNDPLSNALPTAETSKFANSLQGKKKPAPVSTSKAKSRSTNAKGLSGSSHAYDPLNGTL